MCDGGAVEVLVDFGVEDVDELLPDSPPHPATATVAALAASSVSMAVSGFRLMGRAPIVDRGLGSRAYLMSVETTPTADVRGALAGSSDTAADGASLDGRRPRLGWLLAVCCVAQFMVILDLSIVNVALPSIQDALEFTPPELQWVVDAYAITFAGFLMFGGRAADHFGQRRTFVVALLLFAITSLIGGLASSREMLIFARGVQGLGGALMAACSLAIITSSFAPGPQLNRAIGTWAAMNGLGGSAGVLLGGIITQEISWRWILLINPPIAVGAAIVAWIVVRERVRDREETFDLAGAITLTVGQMVLVYGVVEAGLAGWSSAQALGPILGGIALLVVFFAIETRIASDPLIPFQKLTKGLKDANNIVLLFSAALFPMWILSSLYLQQALGLSPLHTGLIFLPMTLVIMLVASRAGRLVSHFGVRPVLGSGLLMLTAGLLMLSRIGPSGSGIVYIMIPGILTAAGIAMSIVPSTIAATQGAGVQQAGLASGLVNTSRQVGGGLGLAVLITLATQHTTHLIGLGYGVPEALTHGFRLGFEIGAGLAGAAALLTFLTLPKPAPELAPAVRRLALGVGATIACFVALVAAFSGSHGPPIGAYKMQGSYTFVTAPHLHPPIVRKTHATTGSLSPGYIFTADFYDLSEPPMIGQSGPLILDRDLQPLWFQPVPESVVAANLGLQTYEGKPVLAWWQGFVTNTGATESGTDVVMNQHYQTVAKLKASGGWVLTLHEFLIDGEDAWVTVNKNVPHDLSNVGGAYNGALIDSAVQEYNLKTGKLLYNWDAIDHIPLSYSYASLPTNAFPWDAYHVNSLQLVDSEHFLVSMRNTWAAYLVNIKTGRIQWTLGGRHSDFRFGRGAAFQWQHDVRLRDPSTVTMYDDHCCQITGGGTYVHPTAPSRGLVLKVDQSRRTVGLAAQYPRAQDFDSDYMGSSQPLPGGGNFVGWGSEPYFSELDRSGKLVVDGEFPWPDISYRATLQQWVGLPLTPPVGAARRTGNGTTVYASWNGATRLAAWRVLGVAGAAGSGADQAGGHPRVVAHAPRSGFETAIPVSGAHTSFEVQALDSGGRVIGTSRPFAA